MIKWLFAILISFNSFYFAVYLRSDKAGKIHPYDYNLSFFEDSNSIIGHVHLISIIDKHDVLNDNLNKDSLENFYAKKTGGVIDILISDNEIKDRYISNRAKTKAKKFSKLDFKNLSFKEEVSEVQYMFSFFKFLTHEFNVETINIIPQKGLDTININVVFEDIFNDTIQVSYAIEDGKYKIFKINNIIDVAYFIDDTISSEIEFLK